MASSSTTYYTYDGITRVLTQQTREEALASFAADIQRALDAIVPKMLSEFQAEQKTAMEELKMKTKKPSET